MGNIRGVAFQDRVNTGTSLLDPDRRQKGKRFPDTLVLIEWKDNEKTFESRTTFKSLLRARDHDKEIFELAQKTEQLLALRVVGIKRTYAG